jgi:hypothetical protein
MTRIAEQADEIGFATEQAVLAVRKVEGHEWLEQEVRRTISEFTAGRNTASIGQIWCVSCVQTPVAGKNCFATLPRPQRTRAGPTLLELLL